MNSKQVTESILNNGSGGVMNSRPGGTLVPLPIRYFSVRNLPGGCPTDSWHG